VRHSSESPQLADLTQRTSEPATTFIATVDAATQSDPVARLGPLTGEVIIVASLAQWIGRIRSNRAHHAGMYLLQWTSIVIGIRPIDHWRYRRLTDVLINELIALGEPDAILPIGATVQIERRITCESATLLTLPGASPHPPAI
jgi:hypothetical protein